MTIAAFAVAVLALFVSLGGAVYARRATLAAEQSANAAKRAEHRDSTPTLVTWAERKVGENDTTVIYTLRNDSGTDLDSITVYPPEPGDGIQYPLAHVGSDWSDAEIHLGPLRMGHTTQFVLAIGPSFKLPEFRVRCVATQCDSQWAQMLLLDGPRLGRKPRIIFPSGPVPTPPRVPDHDTQR